MYFSEIVRISDENNTPIIYSKDIEKLSIEQFDSLIDNMWNDLLDNLSIKNSIVRIMLNNKNIFEYTVSSMIILFIFWRSKIELKIPIDIDDFYDVTDLTKGKIHDTIETIDEKLLNNKNIKIDMEQLAEIDAQIIEKMMKIYEVWAKISASSISLYEIIRLQKRNDEIRYLMNSDLDPSMSIKEMEQEIVRKRNRLIDLILEDNKSCLVNYIKVKRFDPTQTGQMLCNVGPRADSNKFILPIPMTGNFLNGYKNKTEQFIESITGRDALITKDKYVAISGALSRRIDLICLTTNIDHNVEDCGTTHYLEVFVENPNILRLINEKYMINDDLTLSKINAKKDKHLIGQTIKIRSHICCCLPDDRICKTCYGAKSERLKGTNIGGLPSIKFVNPISQSAMSQKHKTSTNAANMKNDALERYFRIENGRCYIREDINVEHATLMIDKDYLEEIFSNNNKSSEDFDDEMGGDYEISLQLEGLKVRDKILNKETREIEEVEYVLDDNSIFLLLSSEMVEKKSKFDINISDEYAYLALKDIEPDTAVFDMLLITEEVSMYLKQLLICINGGNRTRNYPSYHAIIADLLDIIDKFGAYIAINHLETIVYNLIKDKNDILRRPDFTQENPEYTIEPLSKAILTKDVFTSLSNGYLKRQLADHLTYTKSSDGIFKSFFKLRKPIK